MNVALVVSVLLLGAVAATIRFALSTWLARRRARRGSSFPWAVLTVNGAASFVAGLATGIASSGHLSPEAQLVIVTGFAGGLSTFSTLALDAVELCRSRRPRQAVIVVTANLIAGILAVTIGIIVGSLL